MPQRVSLFSARFKALAAMAALACLMAIPPVAAAAERREQATFDLELRGVRAGTIAFSGASNTSAYSAAVRLQSTGLVSLLRRIRYEGQVQGRIASGQPAPRRYQNSFDNGRRETTTVMEYTNRTPAVVARTPPRAPAPHDIEAEAQTGTVDILTAVFTVFSDAPRDRVCNFDLAMFDGRRRTQLLAAAPEPSTGERLTCAGEYRRVAGFSPEEMAERTRYPFTLVYEPGSDGMMQLREVQMESTQGRGRLIRR